MDPRALIDAQFDRAVEIVQSLPKNGPIQTGYEEKLTMYSLYKQATVGNVQSPRPNMWDMLGRAKWDAWAKHKDLDSYEAKMLYVDALLKVLRRYSDKTVAMDLVRELESYGDPSSLVMSGSLSRSRASSSSGSTTSDDHSPHYQAVQLSGQSDFPMPGHMHDPRTDESSAEEEEDENDRVAPVTSVYAQSTQMTRPQSSMSSRRYRTPMAGSLLSPPPHSASVPATQPLPEFHTESAFAEPAPIHASSGYAPTTSSYQDRFSHASTTDLTSSTHAYPPPAGYRAPSQQQQRRPYATYGNVPARPASRPTLERAVENMQATMASLSERLESLETLRLSTSLSSPGQRSPRWSAAMQDNGGEWDLDDMGMWSLVLRPLARVLSMLRFITSFLANGQGRSPAMVIVRRLFLDVSFILCVLAAMKLMWRRSGVRRREVRAALGFLWLAVIGQRQPRRMVDRGV